MGLSTRHGGLPHRGAGWPGQPAALACAWQPLQPLAAEVCNEGLGRIQSRLNAALQRTVGDGLHGLKALRAAAAEAWLLGTSPRKPQKDAGSRGTGCRRLAATPGETLCGGRCWPLDAPRYCRC